LHKKNPLFKSYSLETVQWPIRANRFKEVLKNLKVVFLTLQYSSPKHQNSSASYGGWQPLSVLHLAPSVGANSGGVGQAALSLALEQKRFGCHPVIWTLDASSVAQEAATANGLSLNDIKSFNAFGPSKFGYSPSMEQKAVTKEGLLFNVLHQHSIWMATSRVTIRWRNNWNRPTILSPHGTLEDWAIKRSAWKKRIALFAYEMDNLRHATCLHATAISEANNFRKFGLKNPIAVIPNGISAKSLEKQGNAVRFRSRFAIPSDKRILLFLSRINPIKGLPMLFEAIEKLQKALDDWILVIAGFEDVSGYQLELEQLVKKLNISNKIIFAGPLFKENKEDALAAADIFVLPTHSENFGIVVAEALAAGVPVLTTYGAPWEELLSHNCGWWVEISEQGIYTALQDAISRSKQELVVMGARGKLLVKSKYTWGQVTKMTLELYDWLLGRCDMPNFVMKG
jgi:glycosyltransferase involved in cell wall biosynthesis